MQLAKANTAYQTYLLQPAHGRRPIHGVRFNSFLLASVGFDGSLQFWSSAGDFPNIGIVPLSKRPLLQVDFYNHGKSCAVAASDGNVYLVDAEESFSTIGVLSGHQSYVNGVCGMGETGVISSSDDYTVKIWDVREANNATVTIDLGREATSVAWSDQIPNQVFCGCLDNLIRCYDPRKPDNPIFALKAHKDTITGLSVSFDGREVLSCALDGSLCIWDAAPFSARPNRLMTQITHGLPAGDSISDRSLMRCSWTPDGRYFASGSGSTSQYVVCMWDRKGAPFKAFPGHQGFVVEAAFHPTENLMATCGMDGKLFVGGYL